MWAAAIPVAASVIGGMMSADAAKSSANTLAAASGATTAAQERMFGKQVELQKPFRESGVAASNRLAYLLGLQPTTEPVMSYEQARTKLLGQYTKPGEVVQTPVDGGFITSGGAPTIDEAGLNAAIAQMMAKSAPQVDTTSPEFGSLMRDFGAADFQADPGYQFRQTEGMRGIEGGAAARGGLLSGGTLKAIQKYGQDLASQEYGQAFNRFTGQQTNKYNKLAGLVNTGQGATNQLTNAAGTLGGQIGSNILGAGNAAAAGQIGAANAWTGAIGQGVNAWQQNQLMDLIRNPNSYNAGGSGEFTRRGSQQTSMLNEQWNPNW